MLESPEFVAFSLRVPESDLPTLLGSKSGSLRRRRRKIMKYPRVREITSDKKRRSGREIRALDVVIPPIPLRDSLAGFDDARLRRGIGI